MAETKAKPGKAEGRVMLLDATADRFIQKVPGGVTPLALQKLLYYAQGWHLAATDEPLFAETIQAWRFGPVVPEAYRRFRCMGDETIPVSAVKTMPANILAPSVLDLLDWIVEQYGTLSAAELVRRTHAESPWRDVWGNRGPNDEGHDPIPDESLRIFFKKEQDKLLRAAKCAPVPPTPELLEWARSCAP